MMALAAGIALAGLMLGLGWMIETVSRGYFARILEREEG
jgi:hypothetical protein